MAEGFSPLNVHTDYYKSIGLDRNASNDQIRKRIHHLAKKVHPDKTHCSETEDLMKDLNKVKSVLLDEIEKKRYDEELDTRMEPDIPLFMRKNRGTILLPPALRLSKEYVDLFHASKRQFAHLPKPKMEMWAKLDKKLSTFVNEVRSFNISSKPVTVSKKIVKSAYDRITNAANESSVTDSNLCGFETIQSIMKRSIEKLDDSPTHYSVGDVTPVLNTASMSASDIHIFLSLFTTDLSKLATREEMVRLLSNFIPMTTVQAPPTQKLAERVCASCSCEPHWYSKKFNSCYWCSRQFCKKCFIGYYQYPRIGSTSHLLCSHCITEFTRADGEDWAEAAIKFVADDSVVTSLGCATVAIALGFDCHDLLKNMARELHHQGQLDTAHAVISLAIEMQSDNSASKKQQMKTHHLASSILMALAQSQQKTWEEKWCFAFASKEAYLLATSLLEDQIEVVGNRKQEIDDLVKQLLEEKQSEHDRTILQYTINLESLWSRRNILGMLNYLKEMSIDCTNIKTVIKEDASLKAFQSFLQNKEPFLLSMLPDDRHALLFLKGILNLKEKKFKSALSNIESVAWNNLHSDVLNEGYVLGAYFQAISDENSDLYSYSALKYMLLSGSAEIFFSLPGKNPAHSPLQDRSGSLLFLSDSELSPPFKQNWPSLSVVGLNTRCHQKYEEAVLKLYNENKWSELRVAWAYIDAIRGCEHPAELVVCYLHAAMWLVKQFCKQSKHDLSAFFAFKCVIMRLIKIAYLITSKCLNPGMELYAIRLVIGIMRKMMAIPDSKLILTDEDADFLQVLLKRLVKVSQLFPYWELPTVSVAEAAMFNIITRNLHSDFILGLQQMNPVCNPLSSLDLSYQLYENDLRGILPLKNSSDSRAKAMEELLKSQGWSWKDVVQIMSSRLTERDEQGWLKQSDILSTPQQYSEISGFVVDTDSEHPSLQLILTEASGKTGLFSQEDIHTMLQLDTSDFPLFFSLDPPEHDLDKQYHPFQQWRYASEKVKDTEVLNTMFITDYLMKSFTVGSDVSSLPPFEQRPCREGLTQNLPAKLQYAIRSIHERGGVHSQDTHRFWIEAKAMKYHCQQNGSKVEFRFGEMEMIVKSHSLIRHTDGRMTDTDEEDDPDSPQAMFAKDMTDNYRELSHYFPVFARLRQLSKLQIFSLMLQGVLESLKESAEGKDIDVPKDLVEKIQEDARNCNRTSISTALTKMKQEVGSWPKATDYFFINSKVDEIKADMRRHIREEESRLRMIHGYNVIIDNSDALRKLDDVESEVLEAVRKSDEEVLSQITQALMSKMAVAQDYTLKCRVQDWLSSGPFFGNQASSPQQKLIDYVSPYLPVPTYTEIYNDVLQYHRRRYRACSSLVSSYRNTRPQTPSSCKWVPAAVSRRTGSISYGGVAFIPTLSQVREGVSLPRSRHARLVTIYKTSQAAGRTGQVSNSSKAFTSGGGKSIGVKDQDMLNRLSSAKATIKQATERPQKVKRAGLQPSDLKNSAAVNNFRNRIKSSSGTGKSGGRGQGGGRGRAGGGGGSGGDGGDGGDDWESKRMKTWEDIKKKKITKRKYKGRDYYKIPDHRNNKKFIWVSLDTAKHGGAGFKVWEENSKGTKIVFKSSYNENFEEMKYKHESNAENEIMISNMNG